MKAFLALVTVGLFLVGCTKIAGDYAGTLTESSTIITVQNGRMTSTGGGVAATGATLRVERAGDKLKVLVKGCTILFTGNDRNAEADAGQMCRLSVKGYEGMTAVTGNLTREGRWLNAVVSFAATESGTSGAHAVTFSGTAK